MHAVIKSSYISCIHDISNSLTMMHLPHAQQCTFHFHDDSQATYEDQHRTDGYLQRCWMSKTQTQPFTFRVGGQRVEIWAIVSEKRVTTFWSSVHIPPNTQTSVLSAARQKDISSEVVTTFLKNSACHQMKVHVTLPEEKGLSYFWGESKACQFDFCLL